MPLPTFLTWIFYEMTAMENWLQSLLSQFFTILEAPLVFSESLLVWKEKSLMSQKNKPSSDLAA